VLKERLLSKRFLHREIDWLCLKVYLNAFGKRFRWKLAIGHSVEPLRRKVLPLKARKIMLLQRKCCLTTTLILKQTTGYRHDA